MVILATIYLLNHYQSPRRADLYEISIRDSGLPARLAQAERVYSKVVGERKEMIRKFGPNARDIAMYVNPYYPPSRSQCVASRFPEDKHPWPAYTVCEC